MPQFQGHLDTRVQKDLLICRGSFYNSSYKQCRKQTWRGNFRYKAELSSSFIPFLCTSHQCVQVRMTTRLCFFSPDGHCAPFIHNAFHLPMADAFAMRPRYFCSNSGVESFVWYHGSWGSCKKAVKLW